MQVRCLLNPIFVFSVPSFSAVYFVFRVKFFEVETVLHEMKEIFRKLLASKKHMIQEHSRIVHSKMNVTVELF